MITPPADSSGVGDGELRRRADEDGFLFLRGGVPVALVAALRACVERACAARGWLTDGTTDPALRLGAFDDPRWIAFLQEIFVTSEYRELGEAREIAHVLAVVLGEEPVRNAGDVCRLVSPNAVDLTTPPHQDGAYVKSPRAWTAWMPLGPCPSDLGPLAVLPGSHRGGLRDHHAGGAELATDTNWVATGLEEGDVLLFSALTVHRALPNTTRDRLRMSIEYRYRPASET